MANQSAADQDRPYPRRGLAIVPGDARRSAGSNVLNLAESCETRHKFPADRGSANTDSPERAWRALHPVHEFTRRRCASAAIEAIRTAAACNAIRSGATTQAPCTAGSTERPRTLGVAATSAITGCVRATVPAVTADGAAAAYRSSIAPESVSAPAGIEDVVAVPSGQLAASPDAAGHAMGECDRRVPTAASGHDTGIPSRAAKRVRYDRGPTVPTAPITASATSNGVIATIAEETGVSTAAGKRDATLGVTPGAAGAETAGATIAADCRCPNRDTAMSSISIIARTAIDEVVA
jgi:hypothetical protein